MIATLRNMHWQSTALTDRGRRRRRNEDALLVRPELRLYAVADGMGGHAAGDIAAALAVASLASSFPRAPSARIGAAALGARLRSAFAAAHAAILAQAEAEPTQFGMGTTLSALAPLARERAAVIAHVGDSRVYRQRHGTLTQLTHDHTWVQEQVDAGALTAEQALTHPLSSVLTRVLGGRDPGEADLYLVDAQPGDIFLLCTDGLCGVAADADIGAILSQPIPLEVRARQLVDAALLRGGPDNITVVLLRASAAGETA